MIKSHILLSALVLSLLLSGCTLTPGHFDGEDLLDTGHKTEMQDPVGVPVKEYSDKARVKISTPVIPPPAFDKPLEIKPAEKPVEKPPENIKSEPKPATEKKPEPVKEKQVAAVTCPNVKKGEIMPPPAPGKMEAKKREVLRSGDRLKITVFREKDLSGEYQINDKGTITFPLAGQIMAAGLTPPKVQENLTASLAKGYLVKPEVNVEWLPDCTSK